MGSHAICSEIQWETIEWIKFLLHLLLHVCQINSCFHQKCEKTPQSKLQRITKLRALPLFKVSSTTTTTMNNNLSKPIIRSTLTRTKPDSIPTRIQFPSARKSFFLSTSQICLRLFLKNPLLLEEDVSTTVNHVGRVCTLNKMWCCHNPHWFLFYSWRNGMSQD